MAERLSKQLRGHGCNLAPRKFKEVLAETKLALFPEMTEERLVCADDESITYCEEVNKRIGVALPRPFVRFQLLSNHK